MLSIDQLSDLTDDEDDDDHGTNLIRKPTGEMGKPGSGGYNLQDSLGWEVSFYESVKVSSIPTLFLAICSYWPLELGFESSRQAI
jgi:hypothetical protein